MKKGFFVVAAVIISSQLFAQDTNRTRKIRVIEPGVPYVTSKALENVTVTANKYTRKQDETGKVLNVIGPEQIERSSGKTLSELLNTVPGVNMLGANNNLGTNISPSIRGASVGNVLVLIDGIPVNDPSVISGIFDINFFPLDQVERIEILKGGQSTLYGSDAVAGVINIITKKGLYNTKKMGVNGNFSIGTYNTLRQSVGLSGNGKKTNFSVNYTHIEADGFSTAYDSSKSGNFDDDGFDQHAVNARFNGKIAKTFWLGVFGNYNNYKAELDAGAFRDDRDFDGHNINKQAGANLVYSYAKGAIRGSYSFSHNQRKYVNEPVHAPNPASAYELSNYVGRMHFAELYGNYMADRFELLVGADFRSWNTDQRYYSDGSWGPYSSSLSGKMKQSSPYASVIYKNQNGFNAELGGRVNFHSEYGSNVTFTFNPYYVMENRNKIFANVYSSFKAPTLYQLFDAFAGNPDLDPETGMTVEAGAEMKSVPALKARLTGFYRKGKDVILYTFDPNTFMSKYMNASEQTNYGAELELGYAKEKKDFSLNYTYTDGKTTAAFDGTGAPLAKDTSYYNLYRIPKHAVNVVLGYHFTNKLFTSLSARVIGKRSEYVYAGLPEELKGYATVDLYGEYRMGNFAKFYLDLKNITNKQYFEFLGYNARRFNFTTGISFQL